MPTSLSKLRRGRAAHLRLGRRGERVASRLLRSHGLSILASNVRGPHGEIDLVARDGAVLCFVEVKTRRRNPRTRPADAVTVAKRKRLVTTAKRYLRLLGSPALPWRLDVIEVIYANGRLNELRYWPDEIRAEDLPSGHPNGLAHARR